MVKRNDPPSDEVVIERGGKTYSGRYTVSGRMVTVTTLDYGSKATQVGGSPPLTVARMLLRELVDAESAK